MVFRADLDYVPSEIRSRVFYSAHPSFMARSRVHGMRSRSEKPLLSRPLQPTSLFLPRFLTHFRHTPCSRLPFSSWSSHTRRFSSAYFFARTHVPDNAASLHFCEKRSKVSASEICARENRSEVICYSIRLNAHIFRAPDRGDSPPWISAKFRKARISVLFEGNFYETKERWRYSIASTIIINVFHEQRRIRYLGLLALSYSCLLDLGLRWSLSDTQSRDWFRQSKKKIDRAVALFPSANFEHELNGAKAR